MRCRGFAVCAALLVAPTFAAPRSNRDWAHMTDADWQRIDEELEDPDDKAEREAENAKMKAKFDAAKSGVPAGFDVEAFQRATSNATEFSGRQRPFEPRLDCEGTGRGS